MNMAKKKNGFTTSVKNSTTLPRRSAGLDFTLKAKGLKLKGIGYSNVPKKQY